MKVFSSRPSPYLWLVGGCLLVCYGWLLPNTTIPWIAFHRDAWISCGMALAAVTTAIRFKEGAPWHWITVLGVALAVVPLLQFAFGLLPFAGIAWISTAYVMGWLLAMLTGAVWAQRNAREAADALFLSVGVAAVVSTGIGLYQRFDLDFMGIWILPPYVEHRAMGNLGQPNQLSTLLIWGCLSCGWALHRKFIGIAVATTGWAFLLVGIAATQSRTGWLVLAVFLGLLWYWRRLWDSPRSRRVIFGLVAWFLVLNLSMGPFAEFIGLEMPTDLLDKTLRESRFNVWAMFLDASAQRPWFGYGWTQVSLAQQEVAARHPAMFGTTFSHAHNLFLDFVLFMGWPLGLATSIAVCIWMMQQLKRVASTDNALLMMLVVAVMIHAMLELPLHYAYFLLPTGLAMGILNTCNGPPPLFRTGRLVYAAACAAGAGLLAVLVTDYLVVEDNYTAMRFEAANIGTQPPLPPPDVIALTQMREMLRMARFKVGRGMTEEQLQWMRDVTGFHSSLTNLHMLALALGLNNQQDEARKLLANVCSTVMDFQCEIMKSAWKHSQKEYPELASIPGPP